MIVILFVTPLLFSAFWTFAQINFGQTPLFKGNIYEMIVILLFAIVVFIASLVVRAYKKGKFPSLKGVTAYNIYLLGEVALISSVILFGLYGGTLLGEFKIWKIIFKHFVPELGVAISSLLLFLSGLFNYFNCKVDPPENSSQAV